MRNFQKALFLHIQKTAGSTVVEMARIHYGFGNVISHADYLSIDPERLDHLPFISGHFGFEYAKKSIAQRYSFTFLRDPIERLLSLYSFCRARQTDEYPIYAAARRLSLDEFLLAWERLPDNEQLVYRETLWNHQTWQLCFGWSPDVMKPGRVSILDFSEKALLMKATNNLIAFDYVGFADNFDFDAAHIMENLGISVVQPLRKVNVSGNRIRLMDLPESTLTRLKKLTELDREIYQSAWARRRR
jgi:Sulfotransferase family